MIVVDTSVWIDYFRGIVTPQSDKLDALLGIEQVLTGDLILTEVLQGYESARGSRPTSPKSFLCSTARHLVIDRMRRGRGGFHRSCGEPGGA